MRRLSLILRPHCICGVAQKRSALTTPPYTERLVPFPSRGPHARHPRPQSHARYVARFLASPESKGFVDAAAGWRPGAALAVARIAAQCLRLHPLQRPSLRDIAGLLRALRVKSAPPLPGAAAGGADACAVRTPAQEDEVDGAATTPTTAGSICVPRRSVDLAARNAAGATSGRGGGRKRRSRGVSWEAVGTRLPAPGHCGAADSDADTTAAAQPRWQLRPRRR